MTLEQRYRRLLAAYPRPYRERHGDELVGTLLEAAPPGLRRPPLREAISLVTGGLGARVRAARPPGVRWWADGLQLGLLLVAANQFAINAPFRIDYLRPWYAAAVVGILVALTLGWMWQAALLALPLALNASGPLTLTALGINHWPIPPWAPVHGDLGPILAMWLLVAGPLVLAWKRERPRRSWWWLLLPVAYWGAVLAGAGGLGLLKAGAEAGALVVVLFAGRAAGDARWALAAAVYLLPGLVYAVESRAHGGWTTLVYWGVLTLLAGAAVEAARRSRART
ncbi:hypothetical protein [Herbidospora cretacea]|uniref:hypothetical protein n=1 Tax=Herbidospora cretacea TaxID=28444 RepID=UPI000773C314|nr:hypothetical protein [Herbidospora cretacea]